MKIAVYRDNVIYGIGNTVEDAVKDAKSWGMYFYNYKTASITEKLCREVEKHGGGGVKFYVYGNMLITQDQMNEHIGSAVRVDGNVVTCL